MKTRRSFLGTSLATAAALAGAPVARAQAGRAADATGFVDDFGRKLTAVVNGDGTVAAKKQQMLPLIEQAVAVNDIGQFVLGRYWRIATASQQQRFQQLFHQVLINNVAGKLGEFRGVTYQLTQTQTRGTDYYVGTLIKRPNQEPNNVQWVVSYASGRPEIIDVIAEGTSLRLTQRSDYAAYLSRNGNNVDALLSALERQVSS